MAYFGLLVRHLPGRTEARTSSLSDRIWNRALPICSAGANHSLTKFVALVRTCFNSKQIIMLLRFPLCVNFILKRLFRTGTLEFPVEWGLSELNRHMELTDLFHPSSHFIKLTRVARNQFSPHTLNHRHSRRLYLPAASFTTLSLLY